MNTIIFNIKIIAVFFFLSLNTFSQTWQVLPSLAPSSGRYEDLWFVNINTGWVVENGGDKRILKTTDQHSFTDGMSAGRGYIALAAMIIGKWNPMGAAAACLLFGLAESFTLQFQDSGIPTQFIQMLPYVLTIIVLAGFIGKANPPAADGIPYEKKD